MTTSVCCHHDATPEVEHVPASLDAGCSELPADHLRILCDRWVGRMIRQPRNIFLFLQEQIQDIIITDANARRPGNPGLGPPWKATPPIYNTCMHIYIYRERERETKYASSSRAAISRGTLQTKRYRDTRQPTPCAPHHELLVIGATAEIAFQPCCVHGRARNAATFVL
jgi:hypothetical protein